MPRRPSPAAFASSALALTLLAAAATEGRDLRVRRPLRVPDVPGFVTLRCDLHMHTVFSDGKVWPDVRVEEAWREGYDAIAITDHLEYLPHRADLPPAHDRPFEIAAPLAEKLGLLLVRGSEVTRKMPPGHLNAIFLRTSVPLDVPDWRAALGAARGQGAFLFWNHPGWKGHQKDGVARWYPEHTELLEAGLLDGIEVVNDRDYSPEAHRWALERNLAILASSDVHEPVGLSWDLAAGDHRPVTLAFARERSEAGLREALFARRTVAWSGETLAGREEQLRPLVDASITVENPRLAIRAGDEGYLRVRNASDLRFALERDGDAPPLRLPARLALAPDGTSPLEVKVPKGTPAGALRVSTSWRVANVLVAPGTGLPLSLSFEVEVLPASP